MPQLHVLMEDARGAILAEHTLFEKGDGSVTVGEHARDPRFRMALGQGIPPELELLTRDNGGWNVLRLPTGYEVQITGATWKPVSGGPGEWAHLTPGMKGLAEFRFKDSKNVDRIVRIYFRVL